MVKSKNHQVDPKELKEGINKLVSKLPPSIVKSKGSRKINETVLRDKKGKDKGKSIDSVKKDGSRSGYEGVEKESTGEKKEVERLKLKFRNFPGDVSEFKSLLESNAESLGPYKGVNYRVNKIVVSFNSRKTLESYLSFYNKYQYKEQILKVSELDYYATVKGDYKHLYMLGVPEEYEEEIVEKGLKRRIKIEFKLNREEEKYKLLFKSVSDCVKANAILNNSKIPLVKNKKEKLIKVKTTMESFGTSSRNSSRVFVRNIPFETRYEELLEFFKAHDKGVKVHLPSKAKGYAFVNFSSLEKSKKLINDLNGTLFKKRRIQLSLSLPQQLYDPKRSKSSESGKEEEEGDEEESGEDNYTITQKKVDNCRENDENKGSESSLGRSDEKMSEKDTLDDTIFVRNLDYNCTEKQLMEYFSKHGEVEGCNICLNEDKTSKGTAFVRFKSKEDVKKILEHEKLSQLRDQELDSKKPILGIGYSLQGRRLKIDEALVKDKARMMKKEKDEEDIRKYNEKKNMHLLLVGMITEDSPEYETLSEEQKESVKQTLEKKMEKIKLKNTYVNPKRICIKNLPGNVNPNDLRVVINDHLKSVMAGEEYQVIKEMKNRGVVDVKLLKGDSYTKDEQGVKMKKKKPYAFVELVDHDIAMKIQQFFSNNSTLYHPKKLQCEFTIDTIFGEESKKKDKKLKVKKKKYSRGKRQREKRRELKLKQSS